MPEKSVKAGQNIVICCEGTGNEFGDANSNVVRLYTTLVIDNEQVGYYHHGVGTMDAPGRRTRLGKALSIVEGRAFGAGFMENIESAYGYLMKAIAVTGFPSIQGSHRFMAAQLSIVVSVILDRLLPFILCICSVPQ